MSFLNIGHIDNGQVYDSLDSVPPSAAVLDTESGKAVWKDKTGRVEGSIIDFCTDLPVMQRLSELTFQDKARGLARNVKLAVEASAEVLSEGVAANVLGEVEEVLNDTGRFYKPSHPRALTG